MNGFTMIPVGQLQHHPENPRMDLGDLTELTESIRANGVLQNLTVVHAIHKMDEAERERAEMLYQEVQTKELRERLTTGEYEDPNKYWVVIGNRRFEAAMAAGLTELPCVIAEMDRREQLATMMQENMQRADLTVYEQAQGFQMMMDLGFSQREISEKTGFSETTVSRRLKMAEMDPKELKKACEAKNTERQITLHDFERLSQVESIKERNELLKSIGEGNFNWMLNRALRTQRAKAVRADALKELKDAGVIQLKDNEEYSSKYERLYSDNADLAEWKPGKKLIPKSKEQLYFFMNDDTVKFYTKAKPVKKAEPVRKTEAEKKREEMIENAWKIADRITQTSHDLRAEFAEGLTVKPSNAMQMLRWAIIAGLSDILDHKYEMYQDLREAYELQGIYRWDYVDGLEKQIIDLPQSEWPTLIMVLMEGLHNDPKKVESFACGSRRDWPKWTRNTRIEQCYKWLTEFGYQMSTEEIEMMSGTHKVFQAEVADDEQAGND